MAGPVNAGTALPTVRQLAKDLSRSMEEMGPLPALRELSPDLAALRLYCEGRGVDVDVAISGEISETDSALLAAWISPDLEPAIVSGTMARGNEVRSLVDDGKSVVRVFPATRPPAQKAARPRAAVLVVVSAAAGAEIPHSIDDLVDDRPLVEIIRHTEDRAADGKLVNRTSQRPWLAESATISSLAPGGLKRRIEMNGPDLGALLRTYAALYGVETAAEAHKLVVEQEVRTIRVKRATAQQKTAKLQLGGTNLAEVVADIRVRIQRTLADFEKSVQEGVAELFLPQIGSLSQLVEGRLSEIVDLDRTIGEKSIQLRLLPTDEAELLRLIGEGIRNRAYTDLRSFRDVLELISSDVDRTLASAGAPPVTLRHSQVPDSRVNRVLDSAVRFDRSYRGELPKEGLQEYLQQSRKYQGLLLTIVSATGASFIPGVRQYTAGLSVLLLVVGIISVKRSLPKERAENLAREVEKARDLLRGESKRIFSEAERGWTSAISDALRDEQATVLLQFEAAVREGQSRKNTEMTEERGRVQRAMEGLQHAEGQLSVSGKTRDAVLNAAAQLRGALRLLIAASRTAPTAPTAPVAKE
jgi:hypothetical protein